jgi:hypothetical protein
MIATIDLCLSVFLGVMLIVYVAAIIYSEILDYKIRKEKKRWKKQ